MFSLKKCAICEYEFKPYRNTQKYRKEIELGIYETLEAAIEARRKAELMYFKEYSRR